MAAPKRQRTSTNQQSTLSFNRSKPNSAPANKVSKPSQPATPKRAEVKEVPVEAVQPPPEPEPIEPEPITFPQAEAEQDDEADDNEIAARKVTQNQINSYWAAKERERKTPRVHQGDLTLREKILREFDMSSQYGPCIGISRLDRWKRAQNLELDPPMEVLAVMLKADEEEQAVKPQKKGAKRTSGGKAEKDRDWRTSIMDELIMSSRVAGEVSADA